MFNDRYILFTNSRQNWWTRETGYEVFYPNTFSPILPWTEGDDNQYARFPRFPWEANDFPATFPENDKIKVDDPDILSNAAILGCDNSNRKLQVPITHLSHCTHEAMADKIKGEEAGTCIFKTKEKKPRGNGSSYIYDINDDNQQPPQEISGNVIPGYLSWWGLNVKNWYENDNPGRRIKRAVEELDRNGVYVPNYLQSVPCSIYGDRSFTYDFNQLIEHYKTSRDDCNDDNEKKVHFKKAGTLRYRHEICYVILVCTAKDLQEASIKDMPTAKELDQENIEVETGSELPQERIDKDMENYFQPNGYVTRMADCFNSEYPIRAIYPGRHFYSWDHLSFALYFPNEDQKLSCDQVEPEEIKHEIKACHLGSLCPNRRY